MNNKGITLVTLVVVIVVIIILAGVSISGILNTGTVDIAKEVAFKSQAKDIKDAWETKIIGLDSNFLDYADVTNILSDLNADEEILAKLEIQNGELFYKNDMCTLEEKDWFESVGIFGGISILANVKTYINIVGSEIQREQKEQSMDVIFVLDVSGSMEYKDDGIKRSEKMTNTLNTIVKQIMDASPNNRIGIVQFSGSAKEFISLDHYISTSSDGKYFLYKNGAIYTYSGSKSNSLLTNSSGTPISNKVSITGGTYTQSGLYKAYQIINSRTDKSNLPAIILVTDGLPTYYSSFNESTGALGRTSGNGSATTEHHGKYNIFMSSWIKKQIPDMRIYNIGITDFTGADEAFMKVVLNPCDDTIKEAKNCTKSGDDISKTELSNLITELNNKIKNDPSTNYFYANGFAIGALSQIQLNEWFKSVIDDIQNNLQKGDLTVADNNNITGIYQIDSNELTYTTTKGANGKTEDGTEVEGIYRFKLAEDDVINVTVTAAAFSVKNDTNIESTMLEGSEYTTPVKSFSIQDIKDGVEPNLYYLDGTIKWNVRSEYKQEGLVKEATSNVILPNDNYLAEVVEIKIELPVITTEFTPKSE